MQQLRTYVETLVIGGGQAGLAVGYYLAKRTADFLIVDAHPRIGDSWRSRWDSLRLFTPARYDALPGMPFTGSPDAFPTKDQMADYLEAYAKRFALPIATGVRVDRLSKRGGHFVAQAGERCFETDHVVVAMSNWQRPSVPEFARELRPDIIGLHAGEYSLAPATRAPRLHSSLPRHTRRTSLGPIPDRFRFGSMEPPRELCWCDWCCVACSTAS